MSKPKIEAHKITKPIQLMAVWFIALLLIDSALLTAACKLNDPAWLAPALVIAAILFVPLFLAGIFLMQTVFRKELQEDQYYSEWLKRQEETFGNFTPENVEKSDSNGSTIADPLESQRVEKYEKQQGLFLVHSWRPSRTPGQVADIVIWLHQHGEGPLSEGRVEKVEYELGPKFFSTPQTKTNADDLFRIEVSAWGPMLCMARVFVKDMPTPVILERYVNFEEAPNKELKATR
jgi:hypothetical protein